MTQLLRHIQKPVLLLALFFGVSFSVYSQAAPTTIPDHTTLDQQTIRIFFNATLAGTTNAAQWTVRIDPDGAGPLPSQIVTTTGIAATTAGSFVTPFNATTNQLAIRFDATSLNGAGRPYIMPGQTMTITFANTGSTLTTSGSGLVVAGFTLNSSNNYTPVANGAQDIVYQSEGVASVLDQCSPVNTDFFRWTYLYSLRFRNSTTWTTANNRLRVTWGSGASTSDLGGYLSNAGGDPSTTQGPVSFFTGGNPGVYVSFRSGLNLTSAATGVINVDGTNQFIYPDNTGVCNFRTTQYPIGVTTAVYDAVGSPALQKNTQFNSYDYDDQNTGTLALDPTVANTERVCLGSNVNMTFTDNSVFNCRGNGTVLPTPGQGAAATPINNQQRWIRFIYGGIDSPTPQGNIPDIRVGGIPVTNSTTGALLAPWNTGGGILPGSYTDMTPNAAPTARGYVAANLGGADANGVITLPANATVSATVSRAITTLSAANQVTGQRFYVTIQYWGVCNPYPSSAPVETTVDYVEIVSKPAPLQTAGASVCYGTATPVNFTVTNVDPSMTSIRWYPTSNTSGTAVQSNTSTNFSSSNYTTGNGFAVSYTNNTQTNGRWYSAWATQVVGTGNPVCQSDPIEVVIYQQPRINNLATDIRDVPTPNPAPDVCNNTSVLYTEGEAVPIKTIPINTSTNSAAINFNTENVWSVDNASGVTINPSGSPNGTATYDYAIPTQPTTFVTRNVGVALRYVTTAGAAKSVTTNFPAPTLPASFTYNITPQACTNTATTLAQNIYGTSSGGDVTPATQTICDGATPTAIQVINTGSFPLRGTVQGWEKEVNGSGGFSVDVSLGSANPMTPSSAAIPIVAGATTTYRFRAIVKNGPCGQVFSQVATIVVNPIPAKPTIAPSGATTFCLGNDVTLSSSTVNAASYQWFKDGNPIGGATAQTYFINTVAQSGAYTVRTIGITPSNCQSVLSDPTTVTVHPLPSVVLSGGGNVCGINPAPDVVFTLTGTAPWTIVYSINGANQAPVIANSSPYHITNPPQGAYAVVSITDSNTPNCSVAAPNANITGAASVGTSGAAAPVFESFTATAAVCHDGGSTNPPNAILDLTPNSVISYNITWNINGNTFTQNGVSSDANGVITFSPAYSAWGNAPGSYVITVTAIENSSGCNGVVPYTSAPLVVNPLPPAPTGASNGIACSNPGTGVALSVAVPAVGFEIAWSTGGPSLSAFASVGTGTISGTRNNTYTPAASTTATYYAFTRNTATGCLSSTGLAVTQTQDNIPANANAGLDQPLLCGTSATLAATTPTNSGTGVWSVVGPVGTIVITTPTSPTSTVTGLPQDVPNGAAIQTTLRWTVSSALGACTASQDDVILTVNPLPSALNPAPVFCETVAGGGSVASVSLTTFNDGVTGIIGSADRTITYFSDIARTVNVTATPQSITNGKTYYTRVQTSSTSCINEGIIVFTVNPRPAAVDQNLSFCEDVQGTNIHGPFDLTTNNTTIAGGSMTNRSVTWYSDAGLTVLVPTSASYTLTGSTTLYAQVTNTLTNCTNRATVNLVTKPRPAANPIQGNASVCTGNTVILYQLDPSLNPGSTYTWSVVGTPAAAVQVFGGGGINSANFFVLLKFPAATGTVSLDVFETLNGCTGVTNHLDINVNSAPAPNTINGLAQVCSNQTTVNYQVASPNATSTYTWQVTGATIASSAGPSINVDFSTVSPVTIQVTETSSSGCVGAPAVRNIIVNPRPVMTSGQTPSVCSSATPSLVFTSNIASSFSWVIPPGGITGSITGATVGQSGSGDLSATFTGGAALRNISGAVGSVTFVVTPTATTSGCVGTAQSVVLTVNPEPFLVNAQTKTTCSGEAVNYEILTTPLNLPSGTTFSWPSPVMSDGSTQGSAGNVAAGIAGTPHILDVLINTSALPITATYTITPTSGLGCLGTAKNVVITINPQPVVSSFLDATLCSDVPLGLTLATAAGSVAANNYNITLKSVSAGLVGAATNATIPATGVISTYLSNDSYHNTTTLPGTVTYTVVPVSAAGCAGAPKVITISINPEPALSASLDATVCSDVASGIVLTTTGTSVGAVSFNIVGKTIAPGLVSSGTNVIVPATAVANNYIASDRYTNTTNAPLTVVYQVVPLSGLGCPGDPPKSVTLTIDPEPVVSSSLNNSVCSRSAIALTLNTNGTSVAAASYDITARSIDLGLVASGSNATIPASNVTALHLVNDVFTNTTNTALNVTYTVIPKSSAGCVGDARIITITINPEPVMSNSLDNTICSDIATALILNTNGSSIGASSYNITARNISAGLIPNISNVAVPATGVAANYLAADVFNNVGSLPLTVTYTVVPVSSAGCLGASKIVTLTINPEPVVSGSLSSSVCSSVPIGVVLNTNGSSVAAASYNVTAVTIAPGLTAGGGNASIPNNAVAANYIATDVYSNSGALPLTVSYTIVPVSAAGCLGNAQVITMTVNPEPIISTSLNATLCSNTAIGLTLNTNGTSVGAANYSVTAVNISAGLTALGTNAAFPANSVSANYLSNDRYINVTSLPLTVSYTVVPNSAAGCPGPARIIVITIDPEPVVSNSLNTSVCSDLVTNLTLTTAASSVAAANYNITSRTIAVGLTPAGGNVTVPATAVSAGYLSGDVFTNTTTLPLVVTYTVVPVSGAGCTGAAKIITITIDPEPVVLNTLNTTICSGSVTGLNLGTTGTSVAAANYNITGLSIGAGLTAAGTNVAVPANGVAANYLDSDRFTNTTSSTLTVTYTVVPVSASGCLGDSKVITITVNPEPVVSTLLNSTVCSDAVINLTLNTNGTSVPATNYDITSKSVPAGLIGAGTNVTVPATTVAANYLISDRYNNIGALPLNVTYTVVPRSAGGCLGIPQVITITINPEPVLSSSLNLTQCSDLATALVLNTDGASVAAQNYNITLFSLAAGLTASGGNATLPATGVNANYLGNDKFTNITSGNLTVVYTVTPVSASGCLGNPLNVVVTIQPEPVVATNLNSTTCSDVSTALTLTTNGTSVAANNYNITAISIAPGLIAAAGNAAIPATGVASTYLTGDKFTNTTNGSLSVAYTVVPVSAAGCLGDPQTITITIDPEPVIANGLDATVCSDNSIGLTLNTNGVSIAAANYNVLTRTIATGLISAGTNVAVPATGVAASYLVGDKFTNTGNAALDVVYTIVPVSGSGCEGDVRIITITIDPEPIMSNGLNGNVCSDLSIGLTLNTNGTSVAAANYNIISRSMAAGLMANGANATIPSSGVASNYLNLDKYTNTTNGSLTVDYVVVPVSADGCLGDPKTITITIDPEPVVASSLNTSKCSGLATGLVLATNGSSITAANYNVTLITIAPGLVADGSNAAVANGVPANYLAGDKFVNTGALPLAVTYTVVPLGTDGCLGDPQVITITIDPQPVVATTLDKTVCSQIATALTLNTNGISVGAGTYNITNRVVAPGLTPAITNAVVPFNGVAAGYLSNDKFTNSGSIPLTVVYTVVPISSGGCEGSPQSITVTIDPEPVLSSSLNKTVCSDVAGGIVFNTNGSSVAAANYNVTSVLIPPGLTVVSAVTIPATTVATNYLATDTYTNTGNTSLEVQYTVVPVSAAGCLGASLIIKQIVEPEPVLGSLNKSVCSDDILSITLNTNGTSVAATNYNVTAINVSPGLTAAGTNVIPGNGVPASYIFNDKYTNPGNTPLTVTYSVVPVSAANCSGDLKVITVTINPEPVLSASLDRTVCSGQVSGIVLNTNGVSVAAAAYNITSITPDGSLAAVSGNVAPANGVGVNYIANDKFINTTNATLEVHYIIVPVSAGGCLGDPVDVVLSVDPQPVMQPTLASKTICSRAVTGITLNTNGVSVAAASYNVVLLSKDTDLTGTPTTGTGLAANAILNDAYINVTSAALKVVYRITPRSAAGCFGDAFDITVTVNPEPVINPSLDNTVCSEDISNIILSTNGTSAGAASYELVNVAVPGTITANVGNAANGAVGGINLIRSDKFTNSTLLPATVVYSIRSTSNAGCVGQIQLINLTVNPAPILDPALSPAPVCTLDPSGVTLGVQGGSVAAATYNINSISFPGMTAGASNTGIGTGKLANAIFNDVYINTTNGALSVTYKISPVSVSGCVGNEATVILTINPSPDLSDNLNKTVCNGDVSGIVFTTRTSPTASAPAATYRITNIVIQAGLNRLAGNAVFPRSGVTANDIQNDRFENTTNGPLTVSYTVVPVTGAPQNCAGPAEVVVLTIEPKIIANQPGNQALCSATPTAIALTSPTTPTSGLITFNYTAVSSNGGAMTGFVPQLNSLPQGYVIADNLVNNSNTAETVTYTIAPVANGARNGAGCTGATPVVVIVTVDPKPKVVATPSAQVVCEQDLTSITLSSTTVPSTGTMQFTKVIDSITGGMILLSTPKTTYLHNEVVADSWDNTTSVAQTVVYKFTPSVSGGLACSGDVVAVTITVNPRPVVLASVQAPICSGDIINITLTNDVANSINSWTVSYPDGATGITGANNGAGNLIFQTIKNTTSAPKRVRYTITPKANNCSGTPIDVDVTINPTPDLGTIPSSISVCFGGTLNVPLTSAVAGTSFAWTVDPFPNALGVPQTGSGTSIIQALSNIGTSQEVLTYTITTSGPGATACPGATKFMTVIASPKMEAQFINTDTWLCSGQKDFLQIQLDGQAPFKLVYAVNGVNQPMLSNVGNFKSIQVQPGLGITTYSIVTITDAFNCSYALPGSSPNADVVFTVGETDASFDVITAASCSPFPAQFRYNQVAGVEYTWRFGDGTADSVYIATTNQAGKLIKHTFTNPSPTAELNPKITLQTALPLPFPGCFKSVTKTVKIYSTIITNVFSDKDIICSGEMVQFSNRSTGVTGHRWFYRVQGTNGELDIRTTEKATFTFTNTTATNPIIYEVVYRSTNGNCPAPEVVTPITVYRGVTAGFTEGTVPPFIGGKSVVTFTNTSTPIDIGQIRYDWDFGLDSSPDSQSGLGPFTITYSSPGPREITLTATNIASDVAGLSCVSEFKKTIEVLLLPLVADFKFTPTAACFPQNITITENTATGDVMDWRVIDTNGRVAATSAAPLPVFLISTPGKYTITLKTSNSLTGQVAFAPTTGKDVTIHENPVASFDVRPTLVYVPDTELTTFNFSTGAPEYLWDFGDGETSTEQEPKHFYKVEGSYDITLIAINDHADGAVCTDTLVRKVIAKQGGLTKVPNAFTPNASGPSGGLAGNNTFNDVFLPIVKGAEEFNMQVFDRWGNLLFETNNSNVGWDGYNKDGKLMPAGVYVYKLTVRLSDGQRSTQVGDITMIR